ncbi:hypothetical protein RAZWK3B_09746 [Roseobacter sp. AzwK-3b]|nr:hypothetical protein RAZWK3B_09746 [Roseobacter sp. AzwK-3b]
MPVMTFQHVLETQLLGLLVQLKAYWETKTSIEMQKVMSLISCYNFFLAINRLNAQSYQVTVLKFQICRRLQR